MGVQPMAADINQRPRRRKEPALTGREHRLIERAGSQDSDKDSEQPHPAIVRRLSEVRKL
jgi:hypothetical protein